MFDLVKYAISPLYLKYRLMKASNKSHTFPFENRKNLAVIALSPDANVLISVDEGAPFYNPISVVIVC